MLRQPGHDVGVAALGQAGVDVDVLPHPVVELGGVGAAQGVGREIAKGTLRPMDVLQDAAAGGRGLDAQVPHVHVVPGPIQAGGGYRTVEQAFLDFVADHDVQRIGKLVSLGADQRGPGHVDGPDETLQTDLAKLLRESLLQRRVVGLPEGRAAA